MSWRQNWLVQNILGEIPLIGPFFIEPDCATAAGLAVKCSLALAGSSVVMHLASQHEHNTTELTQDTIVMTAGMTGGKIIYNCGKTILHCFKNTTPAVIPNNSTDDLEMQALRNPDTNASSPTII